MYMLDTNICLYIIKKHPQNILKKLKEIESRKLCISVITFAELLFGVECSNSKQFNQQIINSFIKHLTVLSWDNEAAIQYGKIRNSLKQKGTPIGNMDLMIASHALSQEMTVVTNNIKEFKRVPGLTFENWK